ncbi:---NA--- [Paramuricea clavata]|uniref:---NA n=1 Tax=Paramuricea clavata TaxID=317549 RepID=A0A7D9IHW8_PARCT|nr:---NA--- [Paramuricea clavata]
MSWKAKEWYSLVFILIFVPAEIQGQNANITFGANSYSGEEGTSITICVVVGNYQEPFNAGLTTTGGGTATPGIDYPVPMFLIEINEEFTHVCNDFPTITDDIFEGNETFNVMLTLDESTTNVEILVSEGDPGKILPDMTIIPKVKA